MATYSVTSRTWDWPGLRSLPRLMARAGLSNAEVLRIATVNSAAFLGVDDRLGTLAPGMIANLLVLDDISLADICNTRSLQRVILKGRVIDVSSASPRVSP